MWRISSASWTDSWRWDPFLSLSLSLSISLSLWRVYLSEISSLNIIHVYWLLIQFNLTQPSCSPFFLYVNLFCTYILYTLFHSGARISSSGRRWWRLSSCAGTFICLVFMLFCLFGNRLFDLRGVYMLSFLSCRYEFKEEGGTLSFVCCRA